MTRSETIAFNVGIDAVVSLAEASAAAIGRKLIEKPTRYNFAHEALVAIVEEGRAPKLSTSTARSEPIPLEAF